MRTLAGLISGEHFAKSKPMVLGTNGFGSLFAAEKLLDAFVPKLPLIGLRCAVELAQCDGASERETRDQCPGPRERR